jgi:hypothetical protein
MESKLAIFILLWSKAIAIEVIFMAYIEFCPKKLENPKYTT